MMIAIVITVALSLFILSVKALDYCPFVVGMFWTFGGCALGSILVRLVS